MPAWSLYDVDAVLCGVRLEFLNISYINSSLIVTGINLHSVAGQKQALQLVSLRVLRVFSCQYNSTTVLYLSHSSCYSTGQT